MTFFRIKKIKGNEYSYIVDNKWQKKGSRQKVKGYLGRAYRFELKNNVDFIKFKHLDNAEQYINENDFKKIINDLVEWELFKFGVDKQDLLIDLENKQVQKNKKNIALMINEGFLCALTLKNLLEFKTENQEGDGYRLARFFVEAGIKVPQEIFVGLFGKLYKTTG